MSEATEWLDDMRKRQEETFESLREGKCGCHACIEARGQYAMHMVLCPTCGHKRCPKATWHKFICSHSNEPGQAGSIYGPGIDVGTAQVSGGDNG